MSMIVIDGAHFLSKIATGIGSYARTLVKALRQTGGHQIGVVYGQPLQTRNKTDLELAGQIFGNEPGTHKWMRNMQSAGLIAKTVFGLDSVVRAKAIALQDVDLASFEPPIPETEITLNSDRLYLRAHLRFAVKAKFLELRRPPNAIAAHWTFPLPIKTPGIPNIYTIHDMIPLQFPHFVMDRSGRAVRLHRAVERSADLIITVSEATKRDIVRLLKVKEERIAVTYQPMMTIAPIPQADAERLVQSIYGVTPGCYALSLGAMEPKKNIRRMIEAYLLAGVEIPLLMAGPLGWLYDADLALIDTIKRQTTVTRIDGESQAGAFNAKARTDLPWVNYLGYLPRRHIVALLQCAKFFLFPSVYEGFGLPALEAMQLGIPVITSRTSSLPEVVGNAAVLVNPLDITDMAREIRRLSDDADLRAELGRLGPIQARKYDEAAYQMRLASAYAKVGITI